MRIHAITPYSTVNGPGLRTVIHFQGCKFKCTGCFNPETHSLSGGTEMTLNQVLEKIPDDVDGVTISGGEPFLQARSLLALVTFIKATRRLPIIVFSGFYCDEIEKMKIGRKVLEKIDALIDGRFEEQLLSLNQLRGSANQTIHLFTDVYRLKDFEKREAEVIVSPEGEMFITGFPSKGILEELNLN